MRRIFVRLWALFLVCGLMVLPALALSPDGETTSGMDISVYQGDVDLERSAQAGIAVVYIRAGQGDGYTDPEFRSSADKARQAGLNFGFYYFITARDQADARAQAQRFARLIQGIPYTCRPVADFERTQDMSREQANAVLLAFLEELELRTGVLPMLYTDAYNANTLWDSSLGRYPLWVAQYGGEEPDVTSDVWSAWSGWQYSSRGRVDGVEGVVDLDRFTRRVLLTGQEQPGDALYTVKRGDTLWAIARQYDTTVTALAELNGLANPNRIFVGQRLRIPAGSDGTVKYTVVRGDTLWAIARSHGATVSALAELNGLTNPDLIFPGQVLVLPAA